MTREILKTNAKAQIKGKIGILFLITLIVAVISGGAMGIPIAGAVADAVLITPAFTLSLALIYLKLFNGEEIKIDNVFEGFYHFWGAFKVLFLSGLFTFLWSLLFVIPGIVKSFSYSMASYIYAENKELGALECIRRSKKIMHGHKMDLFVLYLSFIGWGILCMVTFGIASIYVVPYIQATVVNFYKSISATECVEEEVIN